MTADNNTPRMIAEGEGYAVLEIELEDLGAYYIIKGLSTTDFLFSREEWDRLAKIIAYADLKIRSVTE